jgi:hypothetical protein
MMFSPFDYNESLLSLRNIKRHQDLSGGRNWFRFFFLKQDKEMVRDLIGCDKPSKKIFRESSLGLPSQRVFAQVSTIACKESLSPKTSCKVRYTISVEAHDLSFFTYFELPVP